MIKKLTFVFAIQLLISTACFADDELIRAWNEQAIELLKTGNISSPVNKSALYYLARIEKVSPHHEQAKQLRQQIITAYQALSDNNSDANDKKLLRLISSDLQKYSESARLDESTSSARLQRFLKINYPSIKTEKIATLENDYSLYASKLVFVEQNFEEEKTTQTDAKEVVDETIKLDQENIKTENEEVEMKEIISQQPSPEVISWKKKAEQRIAEAKLSLPSNDSALHYLALIEKESISSDIANTIREKIAKRYIGLGNYAISNQQITKGNKWLGIGEHIQNVDMKSSYSNTLESVNAFNRGELTENKVVSNSKPNTTNNELLSIPEQRPQSKLLSQTLEVSVDNSDWINPFDKKRKKSKKDKVELNINEDVKPSNNKLLAKTIFSKSRDSNSIKET